MATAASSWVCHHGIEIVAETNTSKTIRVTAYWHNINWTYNINGVSAWVYCNGEEQQVKWSSSLNATSNGNGSYALGSYDFVIPKTTAEQKISCNARITSTSSYVSGTKYSDTTFVDIAAKPYHTITYDVTGGSGSPANQIKWYDETITLSSTIPVKTGHTFLNWCTNTSNTGTKYNPGDEYSSNANVTLYAIWKANTYTVSYNANGGTGAPANQTKTYGVNLTLSSTKPTKTNYNFLGWSTSADGDVVYKSGASYTTNADVTLYAVWEIAYLKPRINNFTANRCDSSGTINESGTYVKVTFDWATDKTVSGIKIEWKTQTATTWASTTVTASGTSGSVSKVIGSGNISTDTTYLVKASVSDSGGTTTSPTVTLGTIKYPIDVKKGGKGVAIGKAAETDNLFDVAMSTKLNNGLNVTGNISATGTINVNSGKATIDGSNGNIDAIGNLNINSKFSVTASTGDVSSSGSINTANGYKQNDVIFARHSGLNTIISAENGGNIYLRPNGDASDTGRVMIKSDGTITSAGGARAIYGAKVLYENVSGTNGSITLNDSVNNYAFIDIIHNGGVSRLYKGMNGGYIDLFSYGKDGVVIIFCVKKFNVADKVMTLYSYGRNYSYSGSTTTNDEGNDIYVFKVVGYV